MGGLGGCAHFRQVKAPHGDQLNTACQRLRSPLDYLRGSTAQDEEPGRKRVPVGQHPQHLEELGGPLDLINHHQSLKAGQGRHGLAEASQTHWVLKVEVGRVIRRQEQARQSGLPALARAKQGDDPATVQGRRDALVKLRAREAHGFNLY